MTDTLYNQKKAINSRLSINKVRYKNTKNSDSKIIPLQKEFNLTAFTNIISDYANHKFTKKLRISNKNTTTDAIATGINFLGEELQSTTISRDYFSNIYNAVSEVLIVIDKKGYITDINQAAEKLLELKKTHLINTDARKLIQTNFKQLQKEIRNAFKAGKKFYSFESELISSTNKSIPVHCSLSKILDTNNLHKGYLFVAKDISEQKNREIYEKRLVLEEIEKERIRLSKDLHDSIGQEINAVKLYIDSLMYMDSKKADYKSVIETCKNLLNNSIETIREICFNMMPKSLEHGDILFACNELVQKLTPICEIEYNFPKFKISICKGNQTILFRIIQEFICNSINHSKCTKIKFTILKTKNIISISINDNGKGFDINKVLKGNGLNNIVSRIEVLNIKHNFKSQLKKGTSIELFINEEKVKNTIS